MGPPIIGVSNSIEKISELIKHVADTGLNVVITGETGVGKEVVAQNLYQSSPRKGKPFIKVNCAALPDGLLESELYGYERGAFTGAEKKKKGKFELAHGGVLFLDEIGDMSMPLQAKLLHVLQSGEFAPLGSEKEVVSDTWIVAATNHDLEQEIIKNHFREDLYYRLNIITIDIPPLRERAEDISHLIDYYLGIYTSQFNKKNLLQPNLAIIEKLTKYHWPGNVRQLQNVLKSSLVLGDWDKTIVALFSSADADDRPSPKSTVPESVALITEYLDLDGVNSPEQPSFSLKSIKKTYLEKIEREVISYILSSTGWNRSKAAKILKISYKTLLYKITDLNLSPPA